MKKDSKVETFRILSVSKRYEILDPGFYSCTGPEKMLDSRPKGWKFASFWVEKHKFCGFLSCFLLLWVKNFARVEFCIFHSIIDKKVRAFVSVSIDYFL